jgi:hypothetical protein
MVFLVLVLLLMFANEMPQVKAAGFRMRLGLHAFCLVSYLNYLIPIIFGRMGWWTFALAVVLTGVSSYYLVRHLARLSPEQPRTTGIALGWPPLAILVIVTMLYSLKWIPPVPLSMQYGGIYHEVLREADHYKLTSPKPPWYRFWQHDRRVFLARPGDVIFCFVRVFAPRRFTHQIFLVWEKKDSERDTYLVTDRFPLPIVGGRGEGYRGYGAKSKYEPGQWRVLIETEDGRTVGSVRFRVKRDLKTSERKWRSRTM